MNDIVLLDNRSTHGNHHLRSLRAIHGLYAVVSLVMLLDLSGCSLWQYHLVAERQVSNKPQGVVKWSPDASYLLMESYTLSNSNSPTARDGTITLLHIDTFNRTTLPLTGQNAFWSLDSNAILLTRAESATSERQLVEYRLDTHEVKTLGAAPGRLIDWLGNTILYRTGDGVIFAWFDDSGRGPVFSGTTYWSGFPWVAERYFLLSPDHSRAIASGNPDLDEGHLTLVHIDGRMDELLPTPHSIGNCCIWSPNSQYLAYFTVEPQPGIYLLDWLDRQGHLLFSTTQIGEGELMSLSFAPDSRTLAFEWSPHGEGFPADNTQIYLIDVAGSGITKLTDGSVKPHRSIQWSPDGRHIAFLRADRTVWFADVAR